MTVELLSKPSCVQCVQTSKTLDRTSVTYSKRDVTTDETALELAKSLGYLAAPVVVVRDADNNIVDSWSGFQPDRLKTLAA